VRTRRSIDINADIGELTDGGVTDAELMPLITSANIACGGHAGDGETMLRSCLAAQASSVAIGAQISYVDRSTFGRRRLDIPRSQLAGQLRDQLAALSEQADRAHTQVQYIKPHGALYHACLDDFETAEVVGELAAEHDLGILTMPEGALRQWSTARGIRVFAEAFLDRGYARDGRLHSRTHPQALLTAHEVGVRLDEWHEVDYLQAESLCVHSDTPGAAHIARIARDHLKTMGVSVRAFIDQSAIDQ